MTVKTTVNLPDELKSRIEHLRMALMRECPTVRYISADKIIIHILDRFFKKEIDYKNGYDNFRGEYIEVDYYKRLAEKFEDIHLIEEYLPRLAHNYGTRAQAQRRGEDLIRSARAIGLEPKVLFDNFLPIIETKENG